MRCQLIRVFVRVAVVCSALASVACDSAAPSNLDSGVFDLGPALPSVADARAGGQPDANPDLAGFQEPCLSNGDCFSGWCVPFEDYSICTETCLRRESCPDGWDCRIIDNTPPDVVSACLPPTNRLCAVCERDSDCPRGPCYELDGESVCGVDCEADEDCPSGYGCGVVDDQSTCIPQSNSCSCNEAQEGNVRICEVTNGFGTCVGRETCDAELGWTGCSASEPAPEICNQVDDDCNGFTDDILGLGEICEREADVDGNMIACSGRLVCTADSPEPVCTANAPSEELCNFIDDDCDGETDEGFEGRGEVCVVGVGTCQRFGVNDCSDDGTSFDCSVVAGNPVDELCDGLDNDCDGEVDEAFPNLNGLCFAGEGACRGAGAVRCAPDGVGTICQAEPRQPTPETCNGVDDDCDGQADEDYMGVFDPCSVGTGVCRRQGFLICGDDGESVVCSATAAAEAEEICNGLDDDCDGQTDEQFAGLNEACSEGIGACRAIGVTACSADGESVECGVTVGDPIDETCNGVDDDCDETSDEDFPEVGLPCVVGVGACRELGVQECAEDGLGVSCSASAGLPSVESCNGIDDDCDGSSDEDYAALNTPCRAGIGACARNGFNVCDAAGTGTECTAEASEPQPEICNGLDDDCDGSTDETFPAIGQICSSGIGACERTGIEVCSADGASTECSQSAGEPAMEVCNNLDDDCDGVSDESHPLAGRPCEVGVGLCRRSGVFACGDDPSGDVTCDAIPAAPGVDACDYQDNDCDGSVDEDFVDEAQAYSNIEHCGACGSDCNTLWAPNPADFGVAPKCDLSGGVAQCGFDCVDGFYDTDGLAVNGCEFRPDPEAVYVTMPENGGADVADCGPFETPCASVSFGLIQAVASDRARVRVAEGIYDESVALVDGLELLGGHQRTTWDRNPAFFSSILTGSTEEGPHLWTVLAQSIEEPTRFDGFVVRGDSPLTQGNAYGIFIEDSNANLVISNNRVEAGNGGQGLDGDSGASGTPGTAGDAGRPGYNERGNAQCPAAVRNEGGAGGQVVCSGVVANGGQGGGALCPLIERQEGSGGRGQPGLNGGDGGGGGWAFESPDASRCLVSAGGPADASPGRDGNAGGDGRGGDGATGGIAQALQPQRHYQGNAGNAGTDGTTGGGGGGGGAGAGVDVTWIQNSRDIGSSGGGGGSGGCQGLGATGGGSGGGSFGVYIRFSGAGPNGVGDLPVLLDNEITRGLGGRGGAGGNGGGGGEGGPGGLGGPRGFGLEMAFCAFQGGEGGAGGRGGHGGGGGGGAGGISFDIFIVNSNGVQLNYSQDNRFTRAEDEDTFGQGGVGGNSSNTDIGLGRAGGAGISAQVGSTP